MNDAAFIRNRLMSVLLCMSLYSRATIQNSSLTENDVLFPVYYGYDESNIQLNNTVFIRNNLMQNLLHIFSNSHAKLINNTAIENNMLLSIFFSKIIVSWNR